MTVILQYLPPNTMPQEVLEHYNIQTFLRYTSSAWSPTTRAAVEALKKKGNHDISFSALDKVFAEIGRDCITRALAS